MKSWKSVVNNLNAENDRQGGLWYHRVGISHIPNDPHTASLMDIIRVAQLLNYRNSIIGQDYVGDNSLWRSYCNSLADVILEAKTYTSMKDRLIDVIVNIAGD